mmetsp:Transcript_1752/g.7775  ORF Transcript_1752/g.7775 Transcript_1752/m.7775 type:complete len:316 (-) Transcript_1752:478-1425(-)
MTPHQFKTERVAGARARVAVAYARASKPAQGVARRVRELHGQRKPFRPSLHVPLQVRATVLGPRGGVDSQNLPVAVFMHERSLSGGADGLGANREERLDGGATPHTPGTRPGVHTRRVAHELLHHRSHPQGLHGCSNGPLRLVLGDVAEDIRDHNPRALLPVPGPQPLQRQQPQPGPVLARSRAGLRSVPPRRRGHHQRPGLVRQPGRVVPDDDVLRRGERVARSDPSRPPQDLRGGCRAPSAANTRRGGRGREMVSLRSAGEGFGVVGRELVRPLPGRGEECHSGPRRDHLGRILQPPETLLRVRVPDGDCDVV